MDQKRAMLYPDMEPSAEERNNARAAIGLPPEAPPSYDMAMGGGSVPAPSSNAGGWMPPAPSAPVVTPPAPAPEARGPVIVMPPGQIPQLQPQPSAAAVPPHAPVINPNINTLPNLGPNPSMVTCPACGAQKTTRMCFTPNSRTHLSALILCLVGWCCCACCVPYCMDSCRTGNHYCAKCNTFLGAYHPRRRLRHHR